MDFFTLKDLHSKYLAGAPRRPNICLVRGEGNTVFDSAGRSYLDITGGSGENVLGYSNAELTEAVCRQSQTLLCTGDGFYNEIAAALAYEIVEGTVFDKVIFDAAGVSAFACALRLIKNYYDSKNLKKRILVVSDALGRMSYGAAYQNHFSGQDTMLKLTPQNDFEQFKNNLTDDVGAVLLETLQPENGLTLTRHDFLLGAYAFCKSKGALLIMNDFISGVGRTGNFFSFDYSGINPDIVLLSKGLGGGLPLSAVLTRNEIAYAIPKENSLLSSSFLPNLAAARVVVGKLKNGLCETVSNIGDYFKAKLFKLSKFGFVKEIRGLGLIIGMELDSRVDAYDMIIRLSREGILLCMSKNTLIFLPPYTITRAEIDHTVNVMVKVFSEYNASKWS